MNDEQPESLPIAADAPFFDGHFPGNPIVPGAYLLSRVIESATQRYPGAGVFEVANAKFLSMVRPGEDLRLMFTGQAPSVRFTIRAHEQTVVSGSLKILDESAP